MLANPDCLIRSPNGDTSDADDGHRKVYASEFDCDTHSVLGFLCHSWRNFGQEFAYGDRRDSRRPRHRSFCRRTNVRVRRSMARSKQRLLRLRRGTIH